MCGERLAEAFCDLDPAGSSPRVRGTRSQGRACGGCRGIIPACAGNAQTTFPPASYVSDHPRVCGERQDHCTPTTPPAGSSPRVRGTHICAYQYLPAPRIIPACAGNASKRMGRWRATADHPRVCGERKRGDHYPDHDGGSSPRVRGTRLVPRLVPRLVRIIPACAGNACGEPWRETLYPDHPRVCGERAMGAGERGLHRGSSPRVRGTLACSQLRASPGRIIPACAGNALTSPASSRPLSDHPRVCGERNSPHGLKKAWRGSSPRVRGTRHCARHPRRLLRIIPACAGNALKHKWRIKEKTDHPRVCGERGLSQN